MEWSMWLMRISLIRELCQAELDRGRKFQISLELNTHLGFHRQTSLPNQNDNRQWSTAERERERWNVIYIQSKEIVYSQMRMIEVNIKAILSRWIINSISAAYLRNTSSSSSSFRGEENDIVYGLRCSMLIRTRIHESNDLLGYRTYEMNLRDTCETWTLTGTSCNSI